MRVLAPVPVPAPVLAPGLGVGLRCPEGPPAWAPRGGDVAPVTSCAWGRSGSGRPLAARVPRRARGGHMTARGEDGGAAGRRGRGRVGEGGAGIGSGRAAGCRGGDGTGLMAAGQGERRAGGMRAGSAHGLVPGRGAVARGRSRAAARGWRVLLGPTEPLGAGGSGVRVAVAAPAPLTCLLPRRPRAGGRGLRRQWPGLR